METNEKKVANLHEIVIDKTKLLGIIRDNKEKHDSVFEAALEGYWLKADETLKAKKEVFGKNITRIEEDFAKAFQRSDEAIQKRDKTSAKFYFNASVGINNDWPLVYPENHSDEYVKAIRMLELSVYDQVSLTEREFSAYVMNEWEWKASFMAVNTAFVNMTTGMFLGSGLYSNNVRLSGVAAF